VRQFDERPRAELGVAAAAGLVGAAGVALAAVAAHKVTEPALVTAANFLIIHAVAVLAVTGWALRSELARGWWRTAACLILLGVALFAGDIAASKLAGTGLFPMAAPLGGSLTIAGWGLVSVAALVEWRRSTP
jgi:uncharacterized membrane protein YgdD (TMEM256/DUF423 family)